MSELLAGIRVVESATLFNGDTLGTILGDLGGEGTAAGAVHAALHVAAALTYRHNTGEGCFIDVAGVDGVIAQSWIASTYALNDALITDRSTMAQAGGAKYNTYFSRDDFGILF